MNIKIFQHRDCKINYADDLLKVIEFFKSKNIPIEFTTPQITNILLKDCPAQLYLPEDNLNYDVLMYIFDRKQRFYSYALNFSKTLQVIEVSTSTFDDAVDYTWKLIAHELVHSHFHQLRNKGIFLDDPMDLMNGIPYFQNENPYSPNGNFAEAFKRLAPYLKQGYKYFTPTEVVKWKLKPELWTLLDVLRGECGFPFIINSGLRTKKENDALQGSVSDSAHLSGLAVDLHCIYSDRRFKMVTTALKYGVNRIGIGKTFVHLDIDPTKPKNVMWTYY